MFAFITMPQLWRTIARLSMIFMLAAGLVSTVLAPAIGIAAEEISLAPAEPLDSESGGSNDFSDPEESSSTDSDPAHLTSAAMNVAFEQTLRKSRTLVDPDGVVPKALHVPPENTCI